MGKDYFAICITRTCGSGGTEIGKMLSEQLSIDLYDRKLLRLASDDSGINEKLFAKADQDTKKTLLYKVSKAVYNGEKIPPESGVSGKSAPGAFGKGELRCAGARGRFCPEG